MKAPDLTVGLFGRILRAPWLVAVFWLTWACGSDAQFVGHVGKGAFWQIAVDGSRVYVHDETTISIYDFTDPTAPREVGRLESPGYFGAMAASGSVLFVEVGIQFRSLDTSPDSLAQKWLERGWLLTDERSYSEGVFVGASNLTAFDVSDPAAPRVLGILNIMPDDTLASKVERMFLSGSTLYVSPQYNGALIVDVADPRKPVLLGSVDHGVRVALSSRRLFVADGAGVTITSSEGTEELPGGLVVVDVSDPKNTRELGRLDSLQLGDDDIGANVESVAALGDHAYLGLSVLKGMKVFNYLSVVDVADPKRPRQVARLRLKKGIQDLGVVGKTLFAQAEGTILRFDLSDPAKPKQVSELRHGEILRSVFTEEGAYLSNWDGLDLVRWAPPR